MVKRRPRPLLLAGALLLATGCAQAVRTAPPPPIDVGWEETGNASWYGHPYHCRRTASGEVYDMAQMTAAHRTLPFGAWILVENRLNARTTEVRVTDRGPFVGDRILDLSPAPARALGALGAGAVPPRPPRRRGAGAGGERARRDPGAPARHRARRRRIARGGGGRRHGPGRRIH